MLHYTVTGREDGPVLLFLHGFLGSREDWGDITDGLRGEYRCLTVDLPGHGASRRLGGADDYSMEGAAAALRAVLDAEGIDRCGIIGYSMGGRVALYFALNLPHRCSRLVLESASPGLQEAVEQEARRGIDQAHAVRLEASDFTGFLEDWYRQPIFASLEARPELLSRMIARRRHNEPAELARSLRGMGAGVQIPLWERLDELRMPTLFVAGALDGKYVEVAQRMATLSTFVRSAIIPNAGHTIHAEYPKQFTDLLQDFFRTP
jgi:2-succinyl-6-hydroxy-2,4-cyclohexadiene-1-carboxylate synthase